MTASRPRILIIEDDDLQYEIYAEALEGFELTRVTRASEGFKLAAENPPNVILLDHVLEGGELGLNNLPEFKELLPFVPVIIVSGALEVHQQLDALQGPRRADWYIPKPVDVVRLVNTVKKALLECGETEVIRQFEALERSKRVNADDLMSRSTDRLSRQRTIRKQLEGSSDRPNISGLARQFDVARRTIIRDLNELIRRGELPAEVYPEKEGAESEL